MARMLWTRPPASVEGPATQVGPVLGAILLALRAAINRLNPWFIVPALRAGLGAWVASPVGGNMLLLRTRGRKTGLVREAPLSYLIAEGSIWVLAGFGRATHWYRNLLADPRVEVRLPGRSVACQASEVSDQDVRCRVAPALVRATGFPGALIGCNPWTASDACILERLAGIPLIRLTPVAGPIAAGEDDPGGRAWIWRQALVAGLVLGLAHAVRGSRARPQPAG